MSKVAELSLRYHSLIIINPNKSYFAVHAFAIIIYNMMKDREFYLFIQSIYGSNVRWDKEIKYFYKKTRKNF